MATVQLTLLGSSSLHYTGSVCGSLDSRIHLDKEGWRWIHWDITGQASMQTLNLKTGGKNSPLGILPGRWSQLDKKNQLNIVLVYSVNYKNTLRHTVFQQLRRDHSTVQLSTECIQFPKAGHMNQQHSHIMYVHCCSLCWQDMQYTHCNHHCCSMCWVDILGSFVLQHTILCCTCLQDTDLDISLYHKRYIHNIHHTDKIHSMHIRPAHNNLMTYRH